MYTHICLFFLPFLVGFLVFLRICFFSVWVQGFLQVFYSPNILGVDFQGELKVRVRNLLKRRALLFTCISNIFLSGIGCLHHHQVFLFVVQGHISMSILTLSGQVNDRVMFFATCVFDLLLECSFLLFILIVLGQNQVYCLAWVRMSVRCWVLGFISLLSRRKFDVCISFKLLPCFWSIVKF